MTDQEMLEQVEMSKAWIDVTPGRMAWPWNWSMYLSIDTIPVNRDYLRTLLNRLEGLLIEAGAKSTAQSTVVTGCGEPVTVNTGRTKQG